MGAGRGRNGGHMKRKQQGITFLGLLILVAFVGLFVYAGIRLTPAYLEYMTVNKAINDVATENAGQNERAIRIALQKRFDIEDVKSLDWRDIEITRDGDVYVINAQYDVTAPFVANVQFLVSFEKTAEVPAR